MVGIFPVWIIPPLLFLLVAAALPAFLREWQLFVAYSFITSGTVLGLWYLSEISGTGLKLVGVANLLGISIGLCVQLVRLRVRSAVAVPSPFTFVILLVLFVVGFPLTIEAAKRMVYSEIIPPEINIRSVVYMHRGLRARCEVTVWKAADNLVPNGLTQTPYPASQDPLDPKDRWLSGIGCSKMNSDLRNVLMDALESNSAYFVSEGEEGFFIIPSHQLVVSSFSRL